MCFLKNLKASEVVILRPDEIYHGKSLAKKKPNAYAKAKGHYTEGAELIDSVLDSWDVNQHTLFDLVEVGNI